MKRSMAEVVYRSLLLLTALTDALPPRIRFGHWQRVLATLAIRGGLPSVPRPTREAAKRPATESVRERHPDDISCLLVAGNLDGGGVESVIAVLAKGLPAHGIRVEVVVTGGGRIADELRETGVVVRQSEPARLRDLIADRKPDVVQLHRPHLALIEAVIASQIPAVPVFHALESYLNDETWAGLSRLGAVAPSCIAVSQGVKDFFDQRLTAATIRVVLNGVTPPPATARIDRATARLAVARAIGTDIADDDVLVVALQRFSDQKNAAGLVDAFLQAVCGEPRLRLVVAGSPDSWLEVRRADLLRKASVHRGRVHLLGDSDPWTILRAGDLYALDSFAEGGPLTAVEAVMQGLPVVISDVGFARDLVGAAAVHGEVVQRANPDFSQHGLAQQRRRRHQGNRAAFSAAILRCARIGVGAVGDVPNAFTESVMLAGHATTLRGAAGLAGQTGLLT